MDVIVQAEGFKKEKKRSVVVEHHFSSVGEQATTCRMEYSGSGLSLTCIVV